MNASNAVQGTAQLPLSDEGTERVNGSEHAKDGESSEGAEEARRQRRAANRAEYAKRVPEPYVLGPQAYSDPDVWRPKGVEGPLTLDPQALETAKWLSRMDALVDAKLAEEPSDA